MVKSNELFSAQSYLEMVTGYCYIVNGDNDIIFIEDMLNENGLNHLWNYPLEEIDHIVENNLNVVLVDCCVFVGGVLTHEYRWFEVPEGETK